jgi:DsbC/DsbD-like thiol-disulfide interchange protein
MPGGNGVAAEFLLRLADNRHRAVYQQAGRQTLISLAGFAGRRPSSAESLLLATAYQIRAKSADDEHSKPAASLSKPDAELHEPSVAVRLYSSKSAVAPGETFRVMIDFDIQQGWHLYANGSSKSVRPATVELKTSERATAAVARAPVGRALKDQTLMEDVRILEGVAEYELNVTIDKDAPDGPAELKFEVQTQACNDRSCLEPHKSVLGLPITVDRKAMGPGNLHPEVFDKRSQK